MSEIDWPLLQKYIWLMSFQIWMMGPKMWSDSNKMEVLFNIHFINSFPSNMVDSIEPPQPLFGPLTPRLGSSLSLGGWNLTKFIIGKVHYYVCFINFVWKWLTTAPEVHGAHFLPGPDFESKMCYALSKSWMLYNLFCKVFAKFHAWGCRATLTPFWALLTPGLEPSLKLGGSDLTKPTIGKVHYNFCFVSSAWK